MKKGLAILIKGWQFSLRVGIAKIREGRRLKKKLKVKKKQGRKFRVFFFFFIFCLRETEREHCKLSEVSPSC